MSVCAGQMMGHEEHDDRGTQAESSFSHNHNKSTHTALCHTLACALTSVLVQISWLVT